MLVSHRHKFIFIKTIKTAGTSIESYFEQFCLPPGEWTGQHHCDERITDYGIVGYRGPNRQQQRFYNHMAIDEIRQNIESSDLLTYFKFTAIRNPFDKAISAFFHFEKSRNPLKYRNGDSIHAFREWLKKTKGVKDKHLYSIDGNPIMDFYIRYENLYGDIEALCTKLNLPFNPELVPHHKGEFRDKSYSVSDFYDKESIEIINQNFSHEIEYFGYGFESRG